jgi:hypothetical protein
MAYGLLTRRKESPMRKLTMCRIVIGILSPTMVLRAQSDVATPPDVCVGGKTLSSKRAKDVVAVLVNEQGKFTAGDNSFCIEFKRSEDGAPVEVRSVSIEFSQLVGRIQERPFVAQVTQESVGKYFGRVNLGRQYYKPASYYTIVHYLDLAGNKRKVRFLLSVK